MYGRNDVLLAPACPAIIQNISNVSSKLCNSIGDTVCPGRYELLGVMVSPADTYGPQLCCLSHLHIKSGITDKNRILCLRTCRLER